MKKLAKCLLALASIGAAIGLLFAFLKKSRSAQFDPEASDLPEEDDFDLDVDLKPVSEREYVSLHNDTEASDSKEDDSKESDSKDEPAEESTDEADSSEAASDETASDEDSSGEDVSDEDSSGEDVSDEDSSDEKNTSEKTI